MAELWVYDRRPSSMVRYRHGGAAARDGQNILQFPSPNTRPKRSEKARSARPKPKGPKPKGPKKRES